LVLWGVVCCGMLALLFVMSYVESFRGDEGK